MKQSLKRLVIDSATSYLFIGLYEGVTLIEDFYEEGHNDHSVKLMDQLENLLVRHGLKAKALDEIIVGIGPGSYTGLRIGVVVAKMLAFSLNVPIYTVSSLAMLASNQTKEGLILPWIDARREHAFLGLYKLKNNKLRLIKQEQYTHLPTYKASLEDYVEVLEGKPNLALLIESNLLTKVEDVHLLAPVYLRETEAERNLNG